jgi:hypothetical protein
MGNDLPRFLPNYIPPLLPALYAWQVHGWLIAGAVYVVMFLALVGIGWTFLLRGWSFKWLKRARIALILTGMLAVAASGMEICTDAGRCERVFGHAVIGLGLVRP